MFKRITGRCIFAALMLFFYVFTVPAYGAKITEQDLMKRIEDGTKNLKDMSMVANIVYKDKKAMEKMDPDYVRLYEFNSANLSYKTPDKMRMDGKLGMVRFEYIINGGLKIFRAPALKISKKKDYSNDPAKLQRPLDFGLVTASLWKDRRIEFQDDPEAEANGEIKLRLYWEKGDMIIFAWLDSENLWLKRFEKRDGKNNLLIRNEYSKPVNAGEVVWIPTKVDVYAPDGTRVGSTEINEIRTNTGLADTLFQ